MAVISAIVSSIAAYFTFSNDQPKPSGADAVRTAVAEIEGRSGTVNGTLGTPDIVDLGGEYINDPRVVIPVYDIPVDDVQNLVFDLPAGRADSYSQFNELLELFGLDFDSMEQLAGQSVPVDIYGGNLTVDWNEIPDDEEVEEEPEDMEEEVESDSSVTVEETTISPDDTKKAEVADD